MLSFEDFLTERNDSIDDLFFRLLKTVNTEDDQEKRICAAKEALKNLEASEEGFPIDSVLAKEVIRLAEDVLKERKALSGQSLEWDMSIMGSIVETAERILNNAGIQTCYPFFADDEVPCVNTNECHAKAAGKCPFCTQNSEDCADGDCAIHQDTLQILLQKYQKVFGEIIFPDDPGKGQSDVRRKVYANPAGWMYSYDGLRWRTAPMDIVKIAYENAMFRRIPEGIIVGVNDDVKKAPKDFLFSTNNGINWTPLQEEGRPSSSVWVFHGRHDWVWFRRKN